MLDIAVNQKIAHAVSKKQAFILPFNEVGLADIPLVGEKNASLGEMILQLRRKGVKVPFGFATTAYAYRYFLQKTELEPQLCQIFADLNVNNLKNLRQRSQQARAIILNTAFPEELEIVIAQAYDTLEIQYGSETDVAVRFSAISEGLPDANFGGQQKTLLNVHGLKALLEVCHNCFASIFTDSAILFRESKGFDHLNTALSVSVQKMVRSDLAVSGVMSSIDTNTGFKDGVLIRAAYGLSTNVVQGAVNPDEYLVFKPTLKQGYRPILDKRLGTKEMKMVCDPDGLISPKNIPVALDERQQFALNNEEILQLAHWACLIEEHYSQVCGVYTPMNIEWAKDGITDELYIIQARPQVSKGARGDKVVISSPASSSSSEKLPYTRTKIMIDVDNLEEVFDLAALPNDGVGLARMELIIANRMKAHPLALIHFDELEDKLAKYEIAQLTTQYQDKEQFFVDKLAQGISTIAAAFYPKPVIVRLSDYNSNEYTNLLGGKQFKLQQENPMMSWWGASQYYDDVYRQGFALECRAVKRVRDEMGLTNVILMVPFCRTTEEGQWVLAEMVKHGLVREQSQTGVPNHGGLQVFMMCELPNNMQIADELCELFDGFSIGLNDQTQFTLGLAQDSELVKRLFDEHNKAIKRVMTRAISTAKRYGCQISICSSCNYPEIVRFVVEQGIDSISLYPDSVLQTLLQIAAAEQKS